MTDEKQDEKAFKVTDRRRFGSNGAVRDDAPEKPEQAAPDPAPPPQAKPAPDPQPPRPDPRGPARPAMDFTSFVASLATNALAALGALPEGLGQSLPEKNPELAREYIDILTMLQTKTQGNLTAEEDRALTQILTETRMRYVAATQGPTGPGPEPGPTP